MCGGKTVILFCTYCSAEKDHTVGLLTANQRYRSRRIREVAAAADDAGAQFAILSGKFGLLRPDDPIPDYDHLLQATEVAELATRVATQLREFGVIQVIFHTRPLTQDTKTGPYRHCIEMAAALAELPVSFVEYSVPDDH